MTTYSKETALFDTGAIATDIGEAAQTATNYLTNIDASYGVKIASALDNTNYVTIDSNGMSVVKSGDECATFGSLTRIGRNESGYSRVYIDPSSSSGSGVTNIFRIISSNDVIVHDVVLDENHTSEYKVDIPVMYSGDGISDLETTAKSAPTATLTISELNDIPNGEDFIIDVRIHLGIMYMSFPSYKFEYVTRTFSFTFQKASSGSSQTKTRSEAFGGLYDPFETQGEITLAYNPSNNVFTMDVSAKKAENTPSSVVNYSVTLIDIANISYTKTTQVPIHQLNGDVNISGGNLVVSNLVGEIKAYAGSTIPRGWLECDGGEVAIDDYPLLYNAIGDAWGTATDNDHFILPDLRGRTPIGAGLGTASDATSRIVGTMGGSERVTLTTDQMPSHNHSQSGHSHNLGNTKYGANYCASGSRSGVGQNSAASTTINTNSVTPPALGNTGGGQSHGNMQPYATVKYIICAA